MVKRETGSEGAGPGVWAGDGTKDGVALGRGRVGQVWGCGPETLMLGGADRQGRRVLGPIRKRRAALGSVNGAHDGRRSYRRRIVEVRERPGTAGIRVGGDG